MNKRTIYKFFYPDTGALAMNNTFHSPKDAIEYIEENFPDMTRINPCPSQVVEHQIVIFSEVNPGEFECGNTIVLRRVL